MSFSPKQSVQKRILVSLTALTLTAVLAGCSNDDEADLDTTETPDVETEYIPASADGPAQNVPEPKLPAVATENTEEGAEATLEYFWEGIDHVRLTGEAGAITQISQDSCDFCTDLATGWEEIYEEGSWADLDGGVEIEIQETQLDSADGINSDWTSVSFVMTEPAADFYEQGDLLKDESYDTASTAEWWAELSYDGTAQKWSVEWIGLEEHKPEDPS